MAASTLHDYVIERLRSRYGEPATTIGKDSHWELRPYPNTMAINVLVNGSAVEAIVWVFDPYFHGATEGVALQTEEEVANILRLIQTKLDVAATIAKPPEPHGSGPELENVP